MFLKISAYSANYCKRTTVFARQTPVGVSDDFVGKKTAFRMAKQQVKYALLSFGEKGIG